MSKDTIYREDAIKALRCEYPTMPIFKGLREEWAIKTEGFRKAEEVIMNLPSADRPRGMWELVPCTDLREFFEGVKKGFRFRCTNCKDERRRNKHDMNFCPNCGADMRKGTDDGNQ